MIAIIMSGTLAVIGGLMALVATVFGLACTLATALFCRWRSRKAQQAAQVDAQAPSAPQAVRSGIDWRFTIGGTLACIIAGLFWSPAGAILAIGLVVYALYRQQTAMSRAREADAGHALVAGSQDRFDERARAEAIRRRREANQRLAH